MKLRTSFRGKLLLLTIVPLAVVQLVTLVAVMNTVEHDVDKRARASLQIGATVVTEFLSSRSDQLKTNVEVMSADFGLKEVAAFGDIETIRSVLRNHSKRVGAGMALLLDLDGNVVSSTATANQLNLESAKRLIETSQSTAPIQFTQVIGGFAYQFLGVPLRAPTTIGWVVVGFRIDQSILQRIESLTGLEVAIVANAKIPRLLLNSDIPDRIAESPTGLLAKEGSPGQIYLLPESGNDYYALSTQFIADDDDIRVILMQSLRTAMTPYVDARRALVLFALLILSLVAAASAWISAGVAKPLAMLGGAAREMISGHYSSCVAISSDDEIGELASSFNAMQSAISEREDRINHQALHDPLTDLPNRRKVARDLTATIDNAPGTSIAVLSVWLSRMNAISSTLGHNASDRLIRLAANHMRLNMTDSEVLGHVGTDEFIMVLPGKKLEDAFAVAEKFESILDTGVTLDRINIALRTEIGIAIYPEHGANAADLLRNASVARSRAHGSDETTAVYESGCEEQFVRRLRIVNDLRVAIQRNELRVHFQPKMSLPAGSICGAEALVRWQHAEYGWLTPDEFIPAAEEAGTIVHLTRHVLEQAITECKEWEDAGFPLQVSVNISARDLQDEYLPYYVSRLMKEHMLPMHRLTLEVTENSVMERIQKAVALLDCLREMGVRISMDDFGTGHSSLSKIRSIPLDELKIDKSFVMTMLTDSQNEAIVKTTLQLAGNMNLEVVAEGVEDEETLRYLSEAGCQQAQGYVLSKPLPPADFLVWLKNRVAVPIVERRHSDRAFRQKA